MYNFRSINPDVDVEEMKKSDSKSKYVHGRCWRITIPLTLETDSDEIDSVNCIWKLMIPMERRFWWNRWFSSWVVELGFALSTRKCFHFFEFFLWFNDEHILIKIANLVKLIIWDYPELYDSMRLSWTAQPSILFVGIQIIWNSQRSQHLHD